MARMTLDDCDPVGSDDIAQRLDVQRDTVKMWKHRGLMPEPRWTVSGRPCWNWPDIETWARSTGRLSELDARQDPEQPPSPADHAE